MHSKLILDRRDGAQVLCIKPGWREKLLPSELEWAETQPHSLFTAMHHDMRGKTPTALYLHVSGMRCLEEILEDGISEPLLSSVLLSAADVIGACIVSGMDAGFLWFGPAMIYVAGDGYPRFAYLPLEHRAAKHDNPPEGHLVDLLSRISDDAYPACTDRIVHWKRAISDYTHRSLEYLTLRSYSSLLELTLGLSLFPTTRAAVDLLNKRDPQYVDAPHRRVIRQQAPEKGQWRGVSVRGSLDAFKREGGAQGSISTGFALRENSGPALEYVDPPTAVNDGFNIDPDLPTSASAPGIAFVMVRTNDGSRFNLDEGRTMRLGRGTSSDIQLLGNPKISRVHAAVRCGTAKIEVQDLGSANGTWVDGRRLRSKETVAVEAGQPFSLANEEFVVRRGQA